MTLTDHPAYVQALSWDLGSYSLWLYSRRYIILRLHNNDARISSEHCLGVPSTALLPMPTVLSLRLQDLTDRSVCFGDPKISATISPEVASPRCFQELEEMALEHLYSSQSDVS